MVLILNPKRVLSQFISAYIFCMQINWNKIVQDYYDYCKWKKNHKLSNVIFLKQYFILKQVNWIEQRAKLILAFYLKCHTYRERHRDTVRYSRALYTSRNIPNVGGQYYWDDNYFFIYALLFRCYFPFFFHFSSRERGSASFHWGRVKCILVFCLSEIMK